MASIIKVDNVQNQPGTNVINKCGTTITLGASGDTVSLASGASQSGFGRSGSVDWQTTPKTSTFTAADGEGYFVNSGSALTMNLPAGSAGAIVAVSDYARNFATYNLTISPNGSEKIGGEANDAVLDVNGQAATFVYVDSTKGWVNVQNAEDTQTGVVPFVAATGGTITTSGNYKIHTFTGPGTFCVTNAGQPGACASNTVDYLVIAGGGGGGSGGSDTGSSGMAGAGGGAGGYRESPGSASGCYTVSPRGASPAVALPVSVQGYPIVVGAGGTTVAPGVTSVNGSDSSFSTITSTGGGGGGSRHPSSSIQDGKDGGSGGGETGGATIGSGNTPPVSPAQGTDGGSSQGPNHAGGGGGGSIGTGSNATPGTGGGVGGVGGTGATSSINATPTARAGGGGGGGGGDAPSGHDNAGGPASAGGGAGGKVGVVGTAGTANTGGGGGAGGANPGKNGAAGGSGLVIIRYRYQ